MVKSVLSSVNIISAYAPKIRCDLDFEGTESMTKQSFSADCDINNILAKYQRTGLLEHVNKFAGSYGDFLDVDDYQSSLHAVMRAQEEFMSLPSSIRSRFANDPAAFLDAINDPSRRQELTELGIFNPPATVSDDVESGAAQLPT